MHLKFDPLTMVDTSFAFPVTREPSATEMAGAVSVMNSLRPPVLEVRGASYTGGAVVFRCYVTGSNAQPFRAPQIRDFKVRSAAALSRALPALKWSVPSGSANIISDRELGTTTADIVKDAAAQTAGDIGQAAKEGALMSVKALVPVLMIAAAAVAVWAYMKTRKR